MAILKFRGIPSSFKNFERDTFLAEITARTLSLKFKAVFSMRRDHESESFFFEVSFNLVLSQVVLNLPIAWDAWRKNKHQSSTYQ